MSTPGVLKFRSAVRATAIAAVVASGAWYGAGLKTEKEVKQVSLFSSRLLVRTKANMVQVVEKRREATPAEQIAILESNRSALIAKRIGLEKKLKEIEIRAQGATREESLRGQERR